jgi:ABC-type polysaccharide/polyol phosphate transport system ATPase subunit
LAATAPAKTTLLRVLAGIYEPGVGTVRVERARRAASSTCCSVGSEGTGYENILLRGLFLGMRRTDIEAQID